MTKKQDLELSTFEVIKVYEDSAHERHEFTIDINGNEYKGHFIDNHIRWFNPQPQHKYDEINLEKLEESIFQLLNEHGIAIEIDELEFEMAFEDRLHERSQFTLQVSGDVFKGFVHEGEIQWFHPHPHQKLEEEHVQTIEAEVQKMAEKHEENKN